MRTGKADRPVPVSSSASFKTSLRLGGYGFGRILNRRDAESAEQTQRKVSLYSLLVEAKEFGADLVTITPRQSHLSRS